MNFSELRTLQADKEKVHEIEQKTEFLNEIYGKKLPIRQRIWHIDNFVYNTVTCKICKKTPVKWSVDHYRTYCGSRCAHADSEIRQKIEQTCMEKYGAKTNLSTEENKLKQKNTCREKYGVDNYAQSDSFKQQYMKTCMERYGVSNTSKLDMVKEKINQTHEARYGRKRSSQKHIPKNIIEAKNNPELMRYWFEDLKMPVYEIAESLGVNASQLCVHFKKNLDIQINRHIVSKVEKEVQEFVSNLVECDFSNRKILKPKELDIYIPSKQLAIEIDGLAWHCELRGKDREYHLKKHLGCKAAGIRLIQITDAEWVNKREIVESRIKSQLGLNKTIAARKCQIVDLNSKLAQDFFAKTHIQGSCFQKLAYGLVYENQLVAAMSWGKSRFNNKYQWELLRFSNALGTNVVGGADRLFKHFVKCLNPNSIVSYCDQRWNSGELYRKLGFTHERDSGPNYWYSIKYKTLESRIKYQKHKLSSMLDSFDPNLTEWDNMVNNGFDRYWDCGNSVWVWNKP